MQKQKNHEYDIKVNKQRSSLRNIQKNIFRTQLILIITLAFFLGGAGTLINIHFETQKRDQNLQNIAETIACSPILFSSQAGEMESALVREYLDSLKDTLEDIDVISVVNKEKIRFYHSNHELIGTVYEGTIPKFEQNLKEYYIINESGPSGISRRAYAAIYDENGTYRGCVMAILLMKNIREETLQTLFIFLLITIAAIFMELMISTEFSGKIKESLLGYEPDVFTAMYQMRDNILESLDEGILAIDSSGQVQFANKAAVEILESIEKKVNKDTLLDHTLETGEKELNVNLSNADILMDRIPIRENGTVTGAVGILRNRTEYTKLMEDLTGTRYLVDSMRANNHDFTNKLHVILGLIQMEMYDEAVSYIENITMVQRENISHIMKSIQEPAVAALLIGKTARASELNIKFIFREDCYYSSQHLHLSPEILVTIIGNLIENAFEAMCEETEDFEVQNELVFGIYSRLGAVLITVDDTGTGILEEHLEHIFENKYSTKGEGRGTGLYQVKKLVDNLGGTITVESQVGVGTSFSVSFTKRGEEDV